MNCSVIWRTSTSYTFGFHANHNRPLGFNAKLWIHFQPGNVAAATFSTLWSLTLVSIKQITPMLWLCKKSFTSSCLLGQLRPRMFQLERLAMGGVPRCLECDSFFRPLILSLKYAEPWFFLLCRLGGNLDKLPSTIFSIYRGETLRVCCRNWGRWRMFNWSVHPSPFFPDGPLFPAYLLQMPKHMTMGTLSRNPFIASRMSVLVSLKNYMLALQLPLTIIKFETIICLLTRGEEKNPK